MLSLFPQILFLAPLGTMLLRVTAGITFLYIAYFFWTNSSSMAQERLPIVGRLPQWFAAISSLIFAVIGTALTVGLWTQGTAILAALASLKGVLFGKRYQNIFPLSRGAYILLSVICLSLIVSGAGGFAFDLPL